MIPSTRTARTSDPSRTRNESWNTLSLSLSRISPSLSTEKGERSRFTYRGRFSVNIRDGIGGVGVAFATQSAVVVERGVFERSAENFTELASFGWAWVHGVNSPRFGSSAR